MEKSLATRPAASSISRFGVVLDFPQCQVRLAKQLKACFPNYAVASSCYLIAQCIEQPILQPYLWAEYTIIYRLGRPTDRSGRPTDPDHSDCPNYLDYRYHFLGLLI